MEHFDVVVVGAGTAGAATAQVLAESGWSVALVDSRAFGEAGAHWMNGVPPRLFDRAGLPRPEGDELGLKEPEVKLLLGDGRVGLEVRDNPIWVLDMRALVQRLQRDAQAAGVVPFERSKVVALTCEQGRPRQLVLQSGRRRAQMKAHLFVDATGMGAHVGRQVPELARHIPALPHRDVCVASQVVAEVADEQAARNYVRRLGVTPGTHVSWLGIEGGYSALTLAVHSDLSTVELLAGTTAEPGALGGTGLIDRFRAENPWVGETRFGGVGSIPIRRPYDRMAAPGIVLVGNAASQVFPVHGSGVGAGLVAGRILAEALDGHDDPGSDAATWAYQARFQRELGRVFGPYDALRRLSLELSPEESDQLLSTGLIDAATFRAGLNQDLPTLSLASLKENVRGLVSAPSLSLKAAPWIARLAAAHVLYRAYPQRPNMSALKRWSRSLAAVFGDPPDVR